MCIDELMHYEQLREENEAEEQYEAYLFQKEFDDFIKQQQKKRREKNGIS
ncbi:hypothetical protein ACFL3D_01955 [Candidatus Omnitrophota bacterium]